MYTPAIVYEHKLLPAHWCAALSTLSWLCAYFSSVIVEHFVDNLIGGQSPGFQMQEKFPLLVPTAGRGVLSWGLAPIGVHVRGSPWCKVALPITEDIIVGRGCGMDAAGEDLFTGRTSCCYDPISSSRGWAIWGVLTVVRSIWTNVLSVLHYGMDGSRLLGSWSL